MGLAADAKRSKSKARRAHKRARQMARDAISVDSLMRDTLAPDALKTAATAIVLSTSDLLAAIETFRSTL